MENLMEDSVMCKVRAKRGCATHPRSIAERVRRTRISDRIRKLQELVPNMDKDAIKNSNVKRICTKASITMSTPQSLLSEELKAQKFEKFRIGVLGASGYTGSEIIRLLAAHPNFQITLMTADRKARQSIGSVFPHLVKQDLHDLIAIKDANFSNVDDVFCCLPHGTT